MKLIEIDNVIIKNNIHLIYSPQTGEILKPGSVIEIYTKIIEIKNFEDFDYKKFLLVKGIYGKVKSKDYKLIRKQNSYIYKIIDLRMVLIDMIDKIYPGNSAKLVKGILLGLKGDYSEELKTSLSRAGLTHIVAVSGYNITVLIIFLSLVLKPFPKKISSPIIVFTIIAFLFLVGNNSPAIRAGIMGIIIFISTNYSKEINIYTLTVGTAMVLIFINPLILNYDISFQLSFLAIVGLITLGNYLGDVIKFLPTKFGIKENMIATISVLILGMPVMLSNFGQVSIISPISNLITLPLVPFAMLFSGLSILMYSFSTTLGIYVGFVGYIFNEAIIWLSTIFGNLQYSSVLIELGGYIYYFNTIYILGIFILIGHISKKRIKTTLKSLLD